MKSFWIRAANLLAIVGILLAYNMVLKIRGSEEQVARLQAELESANPDPGQEDGSRNPMSSGNQDGVYSGEPLGYRDGVYSGEAEGFGGLISLEATITDGRIAEITILSAEGEDGTYLSMAEQMIPAILESQSPEVDTVSGATFSSNGIKNAVAQALGKAGK